MENSNISGENIIWKTLYELIEIFRYIDLDKQELLYFKQDS